MIDSFRKIPILMYHEVHPRDTAQSLLKKIQYSFVLDVEPFEQQMRYLYENGFNTLNLYKLYGILFGEDCENDKDKEKYIVITFDDGFQGNFKYAFPILQRYGFCATFFVIVNKVGAPYMMDWDQIRLLASAGMSIQSHAMNHVLMANLDDSATIKELKDSKQIIENHLQSDVNFISLPNGSYHQRYPQLAQEVGYWGGCTSNIGYCGRHSNPFLLNRMSITNKILPNDFARVVNGDESCVMKLRKRQAVRKTLEFFLSESTINRLYHLVYGIDES